MGSTSLLNQWTPAVSLRRKMCLLVWQTVVIMGQVIHQVISLYLVITQSCLPIRGTGCGVHLLVNNQPPYAKLTHIVYISLRFHFVFCFFEEFLLLETWIWIFLFFYQRLNSICNINKYTYLASIFAAAFMSCTEHVIWYFLWVVINRSKPFVAGLCVDDVHVDLQKFGVSLGVGCKIGKTSFISLRVLYLCLDVPKLYQSVNIFKYQYLRKHSTNFAKHYLFILLCFCL